MRRVALVSACLCFAPAAAHAQEDPAAVERRARAVEARAYANARSKALDAYEALEAYGNGVKIPPPSRSMLRQWALERLNGPVSPRPTLPAPDPLYHAPDDYERLVEFRNAIRARLRRLDPDRFRAKRPPRQPRAPQELRSYDVQDLLTVPSDHVGPPMGLARRPRSASAQQGGGALSFEEESESETTTTGVGIAPDVLVDLVETTLAEEHDDDSADLSGGRLLVRAYPPTQARVAALLKQLRHARGGLVGLEVRRYVLAPAVLRALGARTGALDEAGEQALRDAITQGDARLVASHRIVAHDGQRVLVRRGASRSYVADLTVDQTGVVPVLAPVVEALNVGTAIEVRPIVDRAAGRVLLDVALSACRPLPGEQRQLAGTQIDLPALAVARTCAAVNVPLGRGALLGGVLRTSQADEALAEVVYVRVSLIPGS